jgi:hypothetical protein
MYMCTSADIYFTEDSVTLGQVQFRIAKGKPKTQLEQGGNICDRLRGWETALSKMNVAILWDIASCSPYVNRRFG